MEMQNQLQNSQSRFVEEIQLQFQALASDMKKLVQFDIPITNENEVSMDIVTTPFFFFSFFFCEKHTNGSS